MPTTLSLAPPDFHTFLRPFIRHSKQVLNITPLLLPSLKNKYIVPKIAHTVLAANNIKKLHT